MVANDDTTNDCVTHNMVNSEVGIMKMTRVLEIALVIIGLYIMFQIVKKLLGGSWEAEDIILALLIFNLGCVFTLGLVVAQIKSDLGSIKDQFRSMATDFKAHVRKS